MSNTPSDAEILGAYDSVPAVCGRAVQIGILIKTSRYQHRISASSYQLCSNLTPCWGRI